MSGMDKLTVEMKEKLNLTDKRASRTVQKSPDDWRKTLYGLGNASGAAQDRISSSRDRDSELDVDIEVSSRRQRLREQRWLENRRSGGVLSQSSDSTRYRLQNQGNEVKSRPNDRKSNTSKFGQRKGGEPGESSKKPEDETTQQQDINEKPPFSDGRQDFNHHPDSQFKPYVSDAQVDEFYRLLEQARRLRAS
jgi:hypothetical protein